MSVYGFRSSAGERRPTASLGLILFVIIGTQLLSAGLAAGVPSQNVSQDERLISLFAEAEGMFASIDQPDSISLFSDIIALR